jgi:hypothetical protein
MRSYPLIDAFVAAADQDNPVERCQFRRQALVKPSPLRRKQHYAMHRRSAFLTRRQIQRFHTFKERFRLEDHPLAAAEWAVIHGVMAIAGKRPQIAYLNLHQPRFARPPNDSKIQRPTKKIRENRDNVYLQTKTCG